MLDLFTENELSAEQEMMLSDGFKMDVLGQPRKNPVPLPTVIKGGRPGAIPNTKVTELSSDFSLTHAESCSANNLIYETSLVIF